MITKNTLAYGQRFDVDIRGLTSECLIERIKSMSDGGTLQSISLNGENSSIGSQIIVKDECFINKLFVDKVDVAKSNRVMSLDSIYF